jgi:hypothetical protein
MNNILDYLIENRETFYVEGTKEGAFNVYIGVIFGNINYEIYETDNNGESNIINEPIKEYLNTISITTIYSVFQLDTGDLIHKYFFYKDGQSFLGNNPELTKKKHRLIDKIFENYYDTITLFEQLVRGLPQDIETIKEKLNLIDNLESKNKRLKDNLVHITSKVIETNKFGNIENVRKKFEDALLDPLNSNEFEQRFIEELERYNKFYIPRYLRLLDNKIQGYILELNELDDDIDLSDYNEIEENVLEEIEDLDTIINLLKRTNDNISDKITTMLLIKKGQGFGKKRNISDLEYLLKLKCF